MTTQVKRFRQISLIESFGFIKKPKINYSSDMENSSFIKDVVISGKSCVSTSLKAEDKSEENEDYNSDYGSIVNSADLFPDESTEETLCSGLFEDISKLASTSGKVQENNNEEQDDECLSFGQNSADLFPDEDTENYSCPDETECSSQISTSSDHSNDGEEFVHLEELNRTPLCSASLPKLEPLENHSIMFSPHIREGDAPRPYPSSYKDKWDFEHIRMPCSPLNKFPIKNILGEKHICSRWDLICESLRKDIATSKDLEDAILSYNSQHAARWCFEGLHELLNNSLAPEEIDHFFEVILPVMIEMALDIPNICTQPVPLLKKGRDHSVTLTQKQIACLLLNAFFCTFPRRTLPTRHSKQRWLSEYANYPDINFNRLFASSNSRNIEKLKCLLNYFRRVTSKVSTGTVTFHRQSLRDEDFPKWSTSQIPVGKAVIQSSGLIETDGWGMLQVDFANKFVGGGVLGQGCVQEEIRFVICPELIVSRLFVEALAPNEVLIITGVEQYNKYSGYSDSFKWEGDFVDKAPRDEWGRRYTQVVAMDATHFRNADVQFKSQYLIKDLNKAYCGFYSNAQPDTLPAVATGNWGCGAFNGQPKLKFLIQLMAASQTGRGLLYLTFGDQKLKKELQKMYNFLTNQNLTVGDVWKLLLNYAQNVSVFNKASSSKLYSYIFSHLLTKEKNCSLEDSKEEESESTIVLSPLLSKEENGISKDSKEEENENDDSLNEEKICT